MLAELKRKVWKANLDLVRYNLVTLTWGNVSAIDRKRGLVAIKPSGISYQKMKQSDIVIIDLGGKKVEGALDPSSDTPTHLELYKAFDGVSAVAHTHSEYATILAQACVEIPCLGTTHADTFNGTIPVTRWMSQEEVEDDYERNTGRVIIERFKNLKPLEMPAVLVAGHGPFIWGETVEEAVQNSVILEKVAKIAWGTMVLNATGHPFPQYLLQKHFERKHGAGAYYGQKKKER